jgi:cobaltochelatase CobN
MKRIVIIAGCALLVVAAVYISWQALRPTRVAFVNFRDWQVAEYMDASPSRFIAIERQNISDGAVPDFSRYDMTVVFGMGLKLTPEQKDAVKAAMQKGRSFYVHASSSPDNDLTNLRGEQLSRVREYLSNGGRENVQAFLAYCRKEIHGRTLFSPVPAEPVEMPDTYFFDPETKDIFTDFGAYDSVSRAQGRFEQDAPRILLLTSNVSPQNKATAEPFLAVMRALRKRGLNVYGASGFRSRLEKINEVKPDCVLLFAHGRLAPGRADSAMAILKKHNVPVFTPLVVHEPIAEWEVKQQGMQGGMLGQSIVVPEIDSGVNPFVIGGLRPNKAGYQVFSPIPERVERLAEMVKGYVSLQTKPNAEKKIAIVYLKGPGKNALVAQGLEVIPSLLNTLRHLKQQGYETGILPDTPEALAARIDSLGPVLGTYAKGAQKAFVSNQAVTRVDADTLAQWMNRALRPELVDSVSAKYGPAPGGYLNGYDSLQGAFLALPSLRFGNVLLLSQLMPAMGDDEFALVHGAKMPPPYPYIATYLFARYGFGADALIHFGTHGSLEFSPWKQSALSSLDWPDVLIGDRPHFYLYTINNIGEAIIAKRRSYADLLSYITPPFRQGDLYGPFAELHRLVHQAMNTPDQTVNASYMEHIRKKSLEIGLDKDLAIPALENPPLSDTLFDKIHRYIHAIEAEKITEGLYTIGIPYTSGQVSRTIAQMFIDPLAGSMAELALLEGATSRRDIDDPHYFEEHFREPALKSINLIVQGKNDPLISRNVIAEYNILKKQHGSEKPDNIMEIMMSMMDDDGLSTNSFGTLSQDSLLNCLGTISADQECRKWFLKLRDEDMFKKTASMLDSHTYEKEKKLSKAIPAMRTGLEQFDKPCVREVIEHMAATGENKGIFEILRSDSVLALAQKKRLDHYAALRSAFSKPERIRILAACIKTDPINQKLSEIAPDTIRFWQQTIATALSLPPEFWNREELPLSVREIMAKPGVHERLLMNKAEIERTIEKITAREKRFIDAVETIQGIESAVARAIDGLTNSARYELAALTNALNGGYIEPSSGGDAVHNPSAVPTGRNLYGIDAESTPGKAAWDAGVALADAMLDELVKKNGAWPRKVAYTLWGGEFIRDRGATVAQILYLLGVEPVRNSVGRVYDVRLIPDGELGRPRIDVLVQTSGQFRDIAATRLYLVDKAVKLAAEAKSEEYDNFVAQSTRDAERVLKEKGLSPVEARELSTARVFGGVNGNYGTGIMGLVEAGDRYDSDTVIANQYLKNMGAIYTKDRWGTFTPGMLEAAVQNTDAIMHSRTSNVSGPLSLDHVYEFMGGLNTVIKKVTGRDPDGMFIDMRNKYHTRVVDAKEAIWTEARSTILNPVFITPLTKGGASSAETFAEVTRNTFAWNVTKESVIDEQLWDRYYETLIRDTLNLGLREFFEGKNPFALQEITAVMLETVRKKMWSPDSAVIRDLAALHVDLVKRHDAGCSGFVCDNAKLRQMISDAVGAREAQPYVEAIEKVRTAGGSPRDAVVLRKETIMETVMHLAKNNLIAIIIVTMLAGLFAGSYVYTRIKNSSKQGGL